MCTVNGVPVEPCEVSCSGECGSNILEICIVRSSSYCNYAMSHLYAGLLVNSLNVFDFEPEFHTVTITVTNTLGSNDSEILVFFTPGQYIRSKVPSGMSITLYYYVLKWVTTCTTKYV